MYMVKHSYTSDLFVHDKVTVWYAVLQAAGASELLICLKKATVKDEGLVVLIYS